MSEQAGDELDRRPGTDMKAPESESSVEKEEVSPVDTLRRSTERVRRHGKGLREVHRQLQSTASRVQALRETARSLGEEIDRTRDAVEQPARELNE